MEQASYKSLKVSEENHDFLSRLVSKQETYDDAVSKLKRIYDIIQGAKSK